MQVDPDILCKRCRRKAEANSRPGRRPLDLDLAKLARMVRKGCTLPEIMAEFGVSWWTAQRYAAKVRDEPGKPGRRPKGVK